MAKYQIKWSEVKKTGETNGRPWKITEMTLTDSEGKDTEKVSTFDSVMTGDTIEGTIVKNDKGYLNFKKLESPEFMKKPNMDRVMEKKAGMISEAQDVKAQNIRAAQDRSAWMWAKNNASELISGTPFVTDETGIKMISDKVITLATLIYNGEPTEPFSAKPLTQIEIAELPENIPF